MGRYKSYRGTVTRAIHDAARETLLDQLYFFLEADVLPVTPIDTIEINEEYGTKEELTSNAKITLGKDEYLESEVYIHFGSDPVSKMYAVIQHENEVFRHDYPTDYKFLENPFEQNYQNIVQAVADSVRKL